MKSQRRRGRQADRLGEQPWQKNPKSRQASSGRYRFGNTIYLTHERWAHIVDPDNHPEVEPFFAAVAETIRFGHRRQDTYDPNSYQYYRPYDDLPDQATHIVVCVRFRWHTDLDGEVIEEKFVATAYLQLF